MAGKSPHPLDSERYDGHTRPHDGNYYIAEVTINGIIAIGDTITG